MMRRNHYNSFSVYALIACLGITLLLGQTFKLHLHIAHDDVSSSATTGHVINVHIDSSVMHSNPHSSMHGNHHENNLEEDHHADEINISLSSLIKKSMSFNQFIFFFFVISIVLSIPQLSRFIRKRDFTIDHPLGYYLLQPTLRAPPAYPA